MSKRYVLAKEVKDQDGGFTSYIVRNSYNIPSNTPLYESPMRNPPTGNRSYTPRIGTSRRYYSPVSSHYGVRARSRSPLSGYYRRPEYRSRRSYSPVSSYYNPYGERDFSHPGANSPNIELGSDDAIVRGVVDYDSEMLLDRPVYRIPYDVDRDDRTDIKIKYGDKILFYVNVTYKSVKTVLNELYTDSVDNAKKGDKLPLIRIEANNLRANLWTKPENLIKRLSNVCDSCSPSAQLKDSKGNKVEASALLNSLKKALGVSETTSTTQNKEDLIGQKDSHTGAGVVVILDDSVVLFKNNKTDEYEDGGGGKKDIDNKDLRATAVRELNEESNNLFNIGKSHLNGTNAIARDNYLGYFVKVEGVKDNDLKTRYDENKSKIPTTEGWGETNSIVIIPLANFKTANDAAIKAKPDDDGALEVELLDKSKVKIAARTRVLLILGEDLITDLTPIKLEYAAPKDSPQKGGSTTTHSYVIKSAEPSTTTTKADELKYKTVGKDSRYADITADDDDTWFFLKWFRNATFNRHRRVYSPHRRRVYSPHRRRVYSPTGSFSLNEREIDLVQ
jgi:hypothetical protein